ncbi:hypothetical protein L0128_03760 [candidate division KSB1 bacterium]|nr:hypothetical protein [candidate division KSB1 bacterium]
MSTIAEVCLVISTTFIVLFVIVLIPVLIRIGSAAREASKLMEMARLHIAPLSHDLAIIFARVKDISASVNRQIEHVEDSIKKFKTYETIVDQRVVRPLIELVALASGFIKGVTTFLRHFKRR